MPFISRSHQGTATVSKNILSSLPFFSFIRYQQAPYNLTAVPAIKDYLLNIKNVPNEQCFQLSLAAEPREIEKKDKE